MQLTVCNSVDWDFAKPLLIVVFRNIFQVQGYAGTCLGDVPQQRGVSVTEM